MKKRIVSLVLSALMVFCIFPMETFAVQDQEDIIILYENDVHCTVEGYSKLSAMKKELQERYAHVGVVSSGDYVQGSSLGVISQGQYIVELMNLVGYDAVTLGNHEFDYRIHRLQELVDGMNTKPICCNFGKIGEAESYFEPYIIVSYGDVDVAYIGITTPSTLTSSSPAQFKDVNGDYIYTFNPANLYDIVQENIDSAKAAGADYVIALSHVGYADEEVYGELDDIEDLIENTEGFDVVLDAHSHSVIEGKTVVDEGGNEVLLSSTGTKFEYIGKLSISDGEFKTELIKTAEYLNTDPVIDAYIEQINGEYAALGERKVGFSEVDLITKDADGNRLIRSAETNLGDLCAEAVRSSMDAEIGYMNGGGIRTDISAGEITFNDLLSVFPFNNTILLAEVKGQTIKDMMEMTMMLWPKEDGSFPHLSGIEFSVDTEIPSSVVLNEVEEFVGVDGPYRVYDIKVFDKETGSYKPLELDETYTFASHNYALLEQGSGMTMLKDAVILQNEGVLDVEVLERYVVETLGGVIGEEYQNTVPNITFTDADSCSMGEGCPFQRYADLTKSEWYHESVHYCIEEGLMTGMALDRFAPNGIITRAQFLSILWSLEGRPLVEIAEGFNDVYEGDWYNNAICWASANNIAGGYGNSIFGPNDIATREQMETILKNYLKYKDVEIFGDENSDILSMMDELGIEEKVMRSQSAAMIYRFCTEIMK